MGLLNAQMRVFEQELYMPLPPKVIQERDPLTLRQYSEKMWETLEPAQPFVPGWHIDAICEHLEACTRGDIKKLIINMPPRHGKSLLVSVFWQTWHWGEVNPSSRWIFASYSRDFAIRDNLKARRLIQSDFYQEEYGRVYRLTGDQNSKIRFENDRTGLRLATSVAGVATGEGGQFAVVDDPHKVGEAESAKKLDSALRWWTETMSTRGNDAKKYVRVIVMQRVSEGDLTGEMLSKEMGYEHLCLPARYEKTQKKYVTSIGFSDPREYEGELLWPAHIDEKALSEMESTLGEFGTASQLQQRPVPRHGGIFDREMLKVVNAVPENIYARYRYWDIAATEKGGAYTVGVRMARTKDGNYFVEDVVRVQYGSRKRDSLIRATAEKDGREVKIFIEQEGGSAGKDAASGFIKLLDGFTVKTDKPRGDKELRADPFASQVNAGNVKLLRGDWNKQYIEELGVFPRGRYKDQVDASSGCYSMLAKYQEAEVLRVKF